jgi:hypothetical protein
VAVSFIGGGDRSSREKPSSCRKSLTNFFTKMLYRVHINWTGFELTTSVVIDTDCIGSCKSNLHAITSTTAPLRINDKMVMVIILWIKVDYCLRLTMALYTTGITSYDGHVYYRYYILRWPCILPVFNIYNDGWYHRFSLIKLIFGPSWLWSHGSWIYNYLSKSVTITTDVVSSNPAQCEGYNIMW